jgi:hypothetical protein
MSSHGGVKKGLFQNSATGQGLETLYGSQAAQANPVGMLTAEAVNPSGYTPAQMAQQTTAAEQTAGGSNAGATGGALLRAARTRNVGAAPAAIGASNRAAGQELSQINTGIQARNADLMQRQRQQGISGLEGLYGENVGAGLGALNASTGALKDAGSLSNFWQDLLKAGVGAAGTVGAAAMGA